MPANQTPVTSGTAVRAHSAWPSWPLYGMFVLFPIWWLIGLGDMIWAIAAVPVVGLLIRRRHLKVPRGFGIWLLFIAWMLISVIEIDSGSRLIGFVYRALFYLGATAVFIYIYNATPAELPATRIAVVLSLYWTFVIAGGYLGVLHPGGSIHTVMEYVIPRHLQQNDLVSHMIQPRFSQYNPTGYYHNAPRPSAPFDYTNNWGANFAELLPFVFIALNRLHKGPLYWTLAALLPISLVPAFLTLNRGMFLALGVGIGYASIRFAIRGHGKALAGVGAFLLLVAGLALVIPVQNDIQTRVANSHTNAGRLAVYQDAYHGALQSPVLGYGAPRPSNNGPLSVSVGTQGQFWNVLFSQGFFGAATFMGWFIWLAWRTRRTPSAAGLWAHIVVLVTAFQAIYYGLTGSALVIAMMAGALALRESRAPAKETPTLDTRTQQHQLVVVTPPRNLIAAR